MLATMTMHVDQLDVPIATVRRLIAEQFPQWTHLPVRAVASSGTVNALFRIGDHLTARFPLQLIEMAAAREWLEEEAEAARELAGRTAYATPEPVAIGEPGAGYPLPWSVQTWVPGTPAAEDDPSDSMAFAHDLAAFVRGVRSIDTRGRTRWRPAHARRLDAGVLRPQRAPRRRPPAPAALGRSSRTAPDQSGRDD